MNEKRWLRLILGLFILLGVSYALVTPVFEASDELWHYPMIRHLADGNPLPVQVFDPAQAGPWKQQASQPPLYYYLGAALTFWIDASDMETVRWENPHVDNGILTADGNNNLTIHNSEWNPWQGTLLAVRIVRLFSVLLGAVTVYLTYRIGKELAPKRPEIGLGAAALNAFTPMFLFISGAVNNDNLAIPLSSLALLMMIRTVGDRYPVFSNRYSVTDHRSLITDYWKNWLLLGTVIGLALLTKEGTFGLLPLAFGTIFIVNWRKWDAEGRREGAELRGEGFWLGLFKVLGQTAVSFLILLLPIILIAGWWYWRNIVLYGDFLGWNAFIAVLGQRAHPASLAQLWSERWGFMLSYWGLFGGVNVPMPLWIYRVLNGVVVAGVIGFFIFFTAEGADFAAKGAKKKPSLFSVPSVAINLQSLVSTLLNFVADKFVLVICLLFTTAVIVGLVQWATTTWSSQGRLAFTAMSAINVLLVAGLIGWLPRRLGKRLVLLIVGFLFIVATLAPFLWIRPVYAQNQYSAPWLVQQEVNVNFDDKLRLVGFEIGQTAPTPSWGQAVSQQKSSYQPGDTVDVMLEWEVLAPMSRNWSVFVHLTDPVIGVPIAQRDMFLDQGLRPTTLLRPGERIFNYYQLAIPETAVAPADLQLNVGLYDVKSPTFERLPLANEPNRDFITLAHLTLQPAAGELPNPTAVNFEDELQLVGYTLAPRQVAAGETVGLTLYWRAKRPLTTDYTVFAQVVDENTTRWASQDLGQPTSSWTEGEIQTVQLSLTLQPETPAAVYPIIIGLYTVEDGQFNRLQIIAADGRPTDDFLQLTLLRINE
ncbi:hypothetical protein MNBD_CHLOROFLEXI01-1929 [hydrothermal vent metagenome]|uniref:Glycosyltransferase RgtA/B/C/D-like domain-containing protein n=1 Tax=hydrothermal vent metagenome TaxID=652676 RepID=A0A3B0VW04_9ZZZZ